MIKYGLFFLFIGFISYEGVDAHPSSRRNDTRIRSMDHKPPRNSARKSMYYGKQNSADTSDSADENSLESVVLAIDTGVKRFLASNNKPDIIDNIAKNLVDFVKKTASNPVYRSKGQEYDIKPELIHFKDDKPSVLLAINSESVINGLKKLLRSKAVHKLMEKFSKDAAVVYRTIKYELDKGKHKRDEQQ